MEQSRNNILQSYTTNILGNHKNQTLGLRETTNKTCTPLRHKNYQFYSPSNASPLRFAQAHLPNRNNKKKSNNSTNFSSTINQDKNKRLLAFCDFKQNISNNRPKPMMSKKLIYNKDQAISQSQNRLLTEPREEQILFIEYQPANFEDNPKFISSAQLNFMSNGISSQTLPKSKVIKSKTIEDSGMFSNIIKKDQKHKRRHSQQSIGDSDMQEGIQYLRCKNNDGKKAKYIVVSKQSIEEDLLYCSNCTISLVQQGFILQKISQQQTCIRKSQYQKDTLRKLFTQQLYKTQNMSAQLQKKQLQKLNQINKFYNEIIDILSQYHVEDIRLTENYFQKFFHSLEERKKFISQQILGQMLEDQSFNELTAKDNTFEKLNINLSVNPQNISEFKKNFNKLFRPQIQQQKATISQNSTSYITLNTSNSTFNNQMRFSFDDPLFNSLSRGQKVKSKIYKGKQQALRLRKTSKNQRKDAFRDLFPQDQSISVNTEISSPTFKQF